MLKHNQEIAQQYMELQIIDQDFKAMRNEMECFWFNISSFLCLKGYELIRKCYHALLTVIYIENSHGSFNFSDYDSIVLKNRQDFCSCYISTANLMQCKHQISIQIQFDISKIDRCWHKRKGISMSSNLRSYSSPRLFSMDLNIDSDESNFDIFDNNIINDYSEIENCFDLDMINADNPNEIINIVDNNKYKYFIIDNNKHKYTLSYKSYTTICDELYNIMRKNKTISTFVVDMLLEMKTVLSSDRTQNMDLNRIIFHFNNFKNTFTPLEKESNFNLNESTSCSLKPNAKRIKLIETNEIKFYIVKSKENRIVWIL